MSYDTYKPGNVHHFLGVDGTRKMFLASHKIANNHEFINLVLLQLKDHLELEMYRTNTTEELWKVLLSLPKLFAQFDNTGVNITDEFEVLIGLNEEHITSECITIILSGLEKIVKGDPEIIKNVNIQTFTTIEELQQFYKGKSGTLGILEGSSDNTDLMATGLLNGLKNSRKIEQNLKLFYTGIISTFIRVLETNVRHGVANILSQEK